MAGPLTGLGSGQQIPLANTFQPGQTNDQVRPDDAKKSKDNIVQPRGAEAAGSQKTETGNHDVVRSRAANDDSSSQKRGALLDIKV